MINISLLILWDHKHNSQGTEGEKRVGKRVGQVSLIGFDKVNKDNTLEDQFTGFRSDKPGRPYNYGPNYGLCNLASYNLITV